MKKIITTFLVIVTALFACEEESRIPTFLNAPNVRLQLHPANSYFNFSDINTAKLVYDLYSENFNEIESVQLSFMYQKNGNPTCANKGCTGPFIVKTYTAADLTGSNGVMTAEEITIQDVATIMGLTPADFTGGDQLFFTNTTTMKDGRVYPSVTVGTNDNVPAIYDQPGASYTASFAAIVGCPLSDVFTGNFKVEQIAGDANWNTGSGPAFGTIASASVTSLNPITRTVSLTYLGFTGRPFNFILLCDQVIVPTQGSGLSCGGGTPTITWSSTGIDALGGSLGTYTATEDNTFDVSFVDNIAPVGCAAFDTNGPTVTTLRFTKL